MSEHQRFGPYQIYGNALGDGAQGIVFQARHQVSGAEVALKLIRLGVDEESAREIRSRVKREVAALSRLTHKGIVRVYDSGEKPLTDPGNRGYLFIAYEMIQGKSLERVLSEEAPPSLQGMALTASQLFEGLTEAHRADVLHRDIKPSNVMLRNCRWESPVLLDFGCAKVSDHTALTKTFGAIGTFAYMAPEVRKSLKSCSPASDQYSLGRLLLEVAGTASGMGFPEAHGSEVDDLVNCFGELAPRVSGVLGRACADKPGDRFATISDLREAFLASCRDDGIMEPEDRATLDPSLRRRTGETLIKYFARLNLRTVDKRGATGGNLWVVAGRQEFLPIANHLLAQGIRFTFAKNGGNASLYKPAWFSRSPH